MDRDNDKVLNRQLEPWTGGPETMTRCSTGQLEPWTGGPETMTRCSTGQLEPWTGGPETMTRCSTRSLNHMDRWTRHNDKVLNMAARQTMTSR